MIALLAPLGVKRLFDVPPEHSGEGQLHWLRRRSPLVLDRRAETRRAAKLHVAIQAARRADVDAFHREALAAGGRDNGAPGVRAYYHPDYYGAFVLDPDGHNIEAVCHRPG